MANWKQNLKTEFLKLNMKILQPRANHFGTKANRDVDRFILIATKTYVSLLICNDGLYIIFCFKIRKKFISRVHCKLMP